MKPVVITGGPGAGKTTLIGALGEKGYATFEEASRRLIEEQSAMEDGILPWNDMAGFASLCFGIMGDQKLTALHTGKTAFMDRALGDICAYMTMSGLSPDDELKNAARDYHPVVFACRPEKSIYVQDDVRPYPFEQALEIHEWLVKTYIGLEFEVVEVPFLPVGERVEFVLSRLQAWLTKTQDPRPKTQDPRPKTQDPGPRP